jgi:hypothetical protein
MLAQGFSCCQWRKEKKENIMPKTGVFSAFLKKRPKESVNWDNESL